MQVIKLISFGFVYFLKHVSSKNKLVCPSESASLWGKNRCNSKLWKGSVKGENTPTVENPTQASGRGSALTMNETSFLTEVTMAGTDLRPTEQRWLYAVTAQAHLRRVAPQTPRRAGKPVPALCSSSGWTGDIYRFPNTLAPAARETGPFSPANQHR